MIALSFRTKAIALALGVQLVMLGLLVWNSERVAEKLVADHVVERVGQARPLLNAALGAPLVESDFITLAEILRDARRDRHFAYFILYDRRGKQIATENWDRPEPPPEHASITDAYASGRFDTAMPITLNGQAIGKLRFGISIQDSLETRRDLLVRNIGIAAATFALSAVLLVAIGLLLTRRLTALRAASERITAGAPEVLVPQEGNDEFALLGRAFNHMIGSLKSRLAELEASKARFHAIADYTYDVEYWYDPNGTLLWINPSTERLTGYSVDECMRNKDNFPWFMVHPDDLERTRGKRRQVLAERVPGSDLELRIVRKDGTVLWLSCNYQPIYSPEGEFLGVRSSLNSIQRLKETELSLRSTLEGLEAAVALQNRTAADLRGERSRLLALLSAMQFGVLFVDGDRRVVYRNPAFTHMWGVSGEALREGDTIGSLLERDTRTDENARMLATRVGAALDGNVPGLEAEFALPSGGTLRQVLFIVEEAGGEKLGHLLLYEDVTAMREAENQLMYLAERDSLTGLFNRRRFEDELTRLIDHAKRTRQNLALLFFDLDEFKSVNDHFGHRMGDAVLVQLSEAIGRALRRDEFFARLGGDEFALLVSPIDATELRALPERIVATIASVQYQLGDQRVTLTGSVGVALYPGHAQDAETLVVQADQAMYQAKDAGKNTWCLYNPELKISQRHRALISWNDQLRNALREGHFRVYCQGVYGASDSKLRYNEALIRLYDPAADRIISPDAFIGHAEKSRLIVEIDRWMILRCLELLAASPDDVPLAVNISGRTFDDADLADYIRAQLAATGVPAHRLHFEITETAAIRNLQDAQRFIAEMHRLGCRVCLDDFGSGFSSFTYVRHLAADILKIDGSFIRDLAHEVENQVFVRAMLDVARGFRKEVVAEGLEDGASLALLRSYGIEMVQGYLLEQPRPFAPASAEGATVIPFGPRSAA